MALRVTKPAFNLRDKLSELDRPVGSHGSQLMKSESVGETFGLVGAGRKNMIINGSMRIDQRYSGSENTANNVYTLDRWDQNNDGTGTYKVQQNMNTISSLQETGHTHYQGVKIISATTMTGSGSKVIHHMIEGYNLARLRWGTKYAKPASLSFWVNCSVCGTFSGTITNESYQGLAFDYTVTEPNTWQHIKIENIPGNVNRSWSNGSGIGARLMFSFGNGPNRVQAPWQWHTLSASGITFGANTEIQLCETLNATWYITGVQLEEGPVCTPFEHLTYSEELKNCQRYYHQIVGTSDMVCVGPGRCNGTTNVPFSVPLSVPLRASPTINACNFAAFTSNNQDNKNNHTPAVTKWDAHSNVLTLQVSGLSGMTNARDANMFLNSSHTLSMDAEL